MLAINIFHFTVLVMLRRPMYLFLIRFTFCTNLKLLMKVYFFIKYFFLELNVSPVNKVF